MASNRLSRRSVLIPAALALGALTGGIARAADDAALIEKGRYLAIAGDCVACHTRPGGKPFAGGESLQTPFGAILATNITPSKSAGIGEYTLAQFADALRKGIRADGKHLYPAMPYTAYSLVTDDDVNALYAYFMHAVEPVDAASPQTSLPFPFNIRLLMVVWNFLFLEDKRFKPDADRSEAWNRGAYLVRGLAHCGTCHTPRNFLMGEKQSRALAGEDLGTWHASNVTSDADSGIGAWSEQELVDYFKLGRAGSKAQAAGPMTEAIDYSLRHLSDDDLRAIAGYLKTVPPIRDAGDSRPPFAWGQPADDLAAVRGVPLPADPNKMSGPELYDAQCATCHQYRGQGSFEGGLPALFHNTSLGRANTNNLVMVILGGVQRHEDRPETVMPGFAGELSDQQVATLAQYIVQRFGNPEAKVSVERVNRLRSGNVSSPLILVAQAGITGFVVVVVALGVWLFVRRRRRHSDATSSTEAYPRHHAAEL
jgi:mono/diheme cytochrome c family protein